MPIALTSSIALIGYPEILAGEWPLLTLRKNRVRDFRLPSGRIRCSFGSPADRCRALRVRSSGTVDLAGLLAAPGLVSGGGASFLN